MRPLRLRIQGFTAFRDEQVIEFGSLESPFAIVGPTGSGKSSVLDAMTYALYGLVDRVRGSDTSIQELISQGQPRMRVSFEFEVGDERMRVTRSLERNRATRILLERSVDGEWRQAGEGADRVKEANRLLQGAIGLDFEGFTRSVLLPQGKFADFMSGDAKERRNILNDLLGLSMFTRMGQRARQIGTEAAHHAESLDGVIASQYADATTEAAEAARAAARAASRRHETLAAAEARVAEIATRWQSVERAALDLSRCATEVGDAAGRAGQIAETLDRLAMQAAGAGNALRQAELVSAAAAKESEVASAAVAAAEREWGTAADLGKLGERARRLVDVRAEVARRAKAVADADAAVPAAVEEATDAQAEAESTRIQADQAVATAEQAGAALRELEHAHAVAALADSLAVGDPCPVCHKPLDAIPPSPGAAEVRGATRTAQAARTAQTDAEAKVRLAERQLDGARQAVTTAERRAAEAREELSRIEPEADGLESEIRAALGELPDDPPTEIAERARRLDELTQAAARSARAAADAERSLREASDATGRIVADAGVARGSLEMISFEAAVARAVEIDQGLSGSDEGDLPPATDLPLLAAAAAERAQRARAYASRLTDAANERLASEPAYLREASEITEGLLPPEDSLPDLVKTLAGAVREAIRDDVQRRNEVKAIETAMKAAASLRAEAATARERGRVFKELANELKADRLIAFLQQEALQLLAIGGSERLSSLSGGRYELEYRGDEFLVVDRWNGDETRSVRTLSGGETFLASLALALALAEQVSSLAVTRHASLDSLFLDEGFGTLDPDTLEAVIEAIERLGGDGRMVGVITHVRELADRMPARIEIEKGQRGSKVLQAV